MSEDVCVCVCVDIGGLLWMCICVDTWVYVVVGV